jgi:RNA polymerase sigma factor (sigma-70 family)
MEQHELVERARRGDGDSFAALVSPHLRSMLQLAGLISGSRLDAEDIVQESLTRVLRSLGRFDSDRLFRPWFATVVANQARNWNRSGQRKQRLTRKIAALADVAPTATDEQAIANTQAQSLLQEVARLEQNDREVLALRFLLDLSEKETAQSLNCSVGTVKSRTSRALQRLRSNMTVRDEDNEQSNNELNIAKQKNSKQNNDEGNNNEGKNAKHNYAKQNYAKQNSNEPASHEVKPKPRWDPSQKHASQFDSQTISTGKL